MMREPRALRARVGLVALGVTVALMVFPLVDGNTYHLQALTFVFMYVALALGLNVLTGLAGLIDLGYIAFFAVGAYGYALLSRAGLPVLAQLPVVSLVATMFGVVLGLPTLRVRGDYLAVVTLGFGEIVRLVATNWTSLTNGPEGLADLPQPAFFGMVIGSQTAYYFLGLVLAGVVAWITHRVATSRLGWAWTAIRRDESLALALGHSVVAAKLIAFCIGANVAAFSGMFFASFQSFVSPESFVLFESIIVLSMVILGGGIRGNLIGVALGAILLALLPEVFRGLDQLRFPAYGAAMLAMVLFREQGLVPWSWLYMSTPEPVEEGQTTKPLGVRTSPVGMVIRGLVKRFGGIAALDGFEYTFRQGRVYGLLGQNGAGKTTLLNVLSGILRPDRGTVTLHGRPERFRWGRDTARTFQRLKLVDDLTVFQNVLLGVAPLDWRRAVIEVGRSLLPVRRRFSVKWAAAATWALERCHVERSLWHEEVGGLPFGIKRLVELARAVARRPGMLLLDEPLSGLSPAEREATAGLLADLMKRGDETVILVEHQYRYMRALCHEVLFMEAGKVGRDAAGQPIRGSLDEVLENPLVRGTFLGGAHLTPVAQPSARRGTRVLALEGVSAGYRHRGTVISEITFAVHQGELVLIRGLNGAGKTTVLRTIAGAGGVHVSAGKIRLRNLDLRSLPGHIRAREGVVYCPQERRVYPALRVEDHFRIVEWRPEGDGIRNQVLEFFPELRHKWHQPAGTLSGGQQQMLALAVSFLMALKSREPAVLLLDEPTTGLQPSLVKSSIQVLAEVKSRGIALVVTEQQAALYEIADCVLELEAGRMAAPGGEREAATERTGYAVMEGEPA